MMNYNIVYGFSADEKAFFVSQPTFDASYYLPGTNGSSNFGGQRSVQIPWNSDIWDQSDNPVGKITIGN